MNWIIVGISVAFLIYVGIWVLVTEWKDWRK